MADDFTWSDIDLVKGDALIKDGAFSYLKASNWNQSRNEVQGGCRVGTPAQVNSTSTSCRGMARLRKMRPSTPNLKKADSFPKQLKAAKGLPSRIEQWSSEFLCFAGNAAIRSGDVWGVHWPWPWHQEQTRKSLFHSVSTSPEAGQLHGGMLQQSHGPVAAMRLQPHHPD